MIANSECHLEFFVTARKMSVTDLKKLHAPAEDRTRDFSIYSLTLLPCCYKNWLVPQGSQVYGIPNLYPETDGWKRTSLLVSHESYLSPWARQYFPAGLEKLTNANRSSRFTSNRQFPWASRKLPIGHFRAHGNCRSAVSVTIGRFLIYGKECVLTLNSIIFPSYILFLVIFGFKKKNGIEY